MPGGTDESRRTASPYSTGGGGTRFEHRLGTMLLVRLLTSEPLLELGERAPELVAFQQSRATSLDDLVATASTEAGTSLRLEIAVRRAPKFITSNKKTQELVAALVRADLDAEREPEPLVEHRLALAVSGQQTHSKEIAELVVIARGQSTAEEFVELIRTPGRFATHSRLDHLIKMVAAALVEICDEDAGSPEHRCWSMLRRLWVMQVDLENGHEDDWTRLISDLRQVALYPSDEAAAALRNQIEQLSAELARSAGVVDATTLRRRLYGHIRPDAHVPSAGWTRLLALDEQTRVAVARSLIGVKSTPLTLPRRAIREELAIAMTVDGDLIVKGDSGVGKSALVMDAIETGELGVNRQAIVLNLRQLPTSHLELLALLSTPLEELFSELTAPDRLLVIDSAEAAAEDHREIFSYLLRSARSAALKVIAITATEGASIVAQLMTSRPRQLEVIGLGDDELATVASQMPVLQRLVDNPRARELLRRPIVIELLARANYPGLPLSEAQALDHIWHHLVRNDEQSTIGAPDARAHVMLLLAAHAVRKGGVDVLLSQLDFTAVDGLRRSGLLLPASPLPWERVPVFKHDLLRAYSVARFLLTECDLAAALMTIGAPRLALASARLACEIVLTAPEEPVNPRAGRYTRLQAGFDAIANAGKGERWSDVPAEALLGVPDGAQLLKDAWPTLLDNRAHGLARLIRILHVRYQRTGILDRIIAEPVISQLLDVGTPETLTDEVDELIRNWLRAHVLQSTPAGQPTRIALRDAILDRCAENERALDEQEAIRQAQLATRTSAEIAADEERHRKVAPISNVSTSQRRSRRPEPTRHRPYQWISDAQIEHLALLGLDLGPEGEAILQRIAEDEPRSLDHAVEPPLAGHSLSGYNSKLLIDLAATYYIEEYGDDDDFECSGGLYDDGIRHHLFGGLGSPLASYTNGPFLSLFRADYRGGVAFLNRMLDHAVRCRVRRLSSLPYGYPIEEDRPATKHVLSITGESREYVGDSQVWLWYRGTGVGPYPCISAMLALESVTEEFIRLGVSPLVLTTIMLNGAHSLAMPALALGVLVRHLEIAGEAIDPYIVEPMVWRLEFSRVINEQSSGFAVLLPKLPRPERRGWSIREVSMMLTLRAEGERIAHLKALGEQLLAKAATEVCNASTDDAHEHLAAVRNWASSLDRAAYKVRQEDDRILIQQTVDPEVEQGLGDTNADMRRTSDAIGLIVRHAHVRDRGGRAPDIQAEALAADIALARKLLDEPPQLAGIWADGPVAAAASAVELHLSGRVAVTDDDLAWSATVLLQVAARLAGNSADLFDDSLFSQGADRSAARSLPFLLLPTARNLRVTLGFHGADDVSDLIELIRAVAVKGVNEVRLAFARTLDAVWSAPCDKTHLHGRCHHTIARSLITESFLDCVIGLWDAKTQRRSVVRLDPPEASTLDALHGENIYGRRLTPALRAMGAAAISSACCRDDAQAALRPLLAAHQRAMLAYDHGYHHSQSDALLAARAALWQAIGRRDDVVLDHIRSCLSNARVLSEALLALAAAAEERVEAGQHARQLWPSVMDLVLDSAEVNSDLFTERTWGDYAQAVLIPNPVAEWGYPTIELSGQPYRWRDLLAWKPQVDRWLGTITHTSKCIDHLVIAVQDLDAANQIEQGLRWIERIVAESGSNCASTSMLPEWLHERQADLVTPDQSARWQRVVDLLIVAGDSRVADLAD
jgi:hypothetical protein